MFKTAPEDVARAVIEGIRKNKRRIVHGHLSTRARILHNLVPLKAVTTLFNKGLRREERRQG